MGLDYRTLIAAGAWDGSVGAGATTFGERGGIVSYGGVGDYDLTLDNDADINECAVLTGLLGLNDHTVRTVHTSDTVKQMLIETTAAGAAGEGDLNYVVIRFAP